MPKTFAGRVLRPTALRELLAHTRGEDRERLRMLFGSLPPAAREEDTR